MGRDVRYLPRPGSTVELTQRTIQGRFLLRPDGRLNELVVGILAKAQAVTGLRIHAVVVLSNHLHVIASPIDVEQMADFMRHLKTNLSKEVGRLQGWRGPMFDRRYTSIPVSDETEAQVARLRYLLSQGTKEGLVMSPADWPGVQCVEAICLGENLRGVWVDRTRLFAARQRGEDVTEADFEVDVELELTPLPCWAHLDADDYQSRVRALVRDIEVETIERHRRDGTVPKGAAWVMRRSPRERPHEVVTSPRPRFHAFRRKVREELVAAFRAFLAAYRVAAERLRAGEADVVFPENCFPPRRPFVSAARLAPD